MVVPNTENLDTAKLYVYMYFIRLARFLPVDDASFSLVMVKKVVVSELGHTWMTEEKEKKNSLIDKRIEKGKERK